ncbi:hypothetical protein AAVH_38661 [Aphelenchoides avenae]|nr:hypothetical protein AAVH_38661 [Aphelenchus avenae]
MIHIPMRLFTAFFFAFLASLSLVDSRPSLVIPTRWNCRSYTSEGADTCLSVGIRFGLTRGRLMALNPDLNCEEEIQEGTELCVGVIAKRLLAKRDTAEKRAEVAALHSKTAGDLSVLDVFWFPPQPTIRFG